MNPAVCTQASRAGAAVVLLLLSLDPAVIITGHVTSSEVFETWDRKGCVCVCVCLCVCVCVCVCM